MSGTGALSEEVLEKLATVSGSHFEKSADFGLRTTYRVGGRCAALVTCTNLSSLEAVLDHVDPGPIYVLGNGSNTLVSDSGWDGVVVTLAGEFDEIRVLEGSVRLGGAVSLPVAARQLSAIGVGGLEWAVGIPGTVGGAVKMNAGGHGSDTSKWLASTELLRHQSSGYRLETAHVSDLDLRYRGSNIGDLDVVASAIFRSVGRDKSEAREMISDIVKWRREHQPGGQNAGSVFVNPEGEHAARLIESLGLKGLRYKSAEVSPRHANFIQSEPGGSGDDVFELIWTVQQKVEKQLGFRLRTEIKLMGFDLERSSYLRGG